MCVRYVRTCTAYVAVLYTHIYTCMYVHVHMCVHVFTCVYVRIYVCTYLCSYVVSCPSSQKELKVWGDRSLANVCTFLHVTPALCPHPYVRTVDVTSDLHPYPCVTSDLHPYPCVTSDLCPHPYVSPHPYPCVTSDLCPHPYVSPLSFVPTLVSPLTFVPTPMHTHNRHCPMLQGSWVTGLSCRQVSSPRKLTRSTTSSSLSIARRPLSWCSNSQR